MLTMGQIRGDVSLDAGLLVGEGTDHGQNNLLAVVGFEQQVEPYNDEGQKERQVQDDGDNRAENWNDAERERDDRHHNIRCEPGDVQKNGLEGMEADGSILVIGSEHQEQNSSDEAQQIAERPGQIVVHRDRR